MFLVSWPVSNYKFLANNIDTVPEFVSQRRRWLNGAFFAAVYSLVHFRQVWQTDHSIGRKILLHIEFIYQFISLLFTFFSLANFYLTFYFVAGSLSDPKVDPFGHHIGLYLFVILRYTCVLLICTQFILSMGNRPQGAKRLYFTSMVLYGLIMAYNTFAAVYIVIRQLKGSDLHVGKNAFTNLVVSTASTVGLYFLMSFLYLDPWHMITSSAQYFMLLPSYICTLQVYAFCNTHDISWGTKGDNVIHTDLGSAKGKGATVELEMPSEQLDIDSGYDEALRNLRDRVEVPVAEMSESQQQEDYYKSVRTYMVLVWMMSNAILAMAVSEAYSGTDVGDNVYLSFILWAVACLALFRAIGSGTFGIINAVEAIVEGRVRMRMKVPKWAGGIGEKFSGKFSGWRSGVSSLGSVKS
jgi:chitin synthase